MPRLAVALAIVLATPFATSLAAPLAGGGAPVRAGSSCGTDHDSLATAPSTIRVHRTETDTVDVVPFREYVGVVMASGEWPYYLPQAVLEVGATATKQYAWYYTLEGHHRSWYRTADGVCYDVKDTTNDQLYRPERSTVRQNQLDAIEATWGLTLRKNDRFFLTGYRAGEEPECGADANGWKIYAKSAVDCAEKGMDRQAIQELYLKPKLNFVWTEGGPPEEPPPDPADIPDVEAPKTVLTRNGTLTGRSITVSWDATHESGIKRYALERKIDKGSWLPITLGSKLTTEVTLGIEDGHSYKFRVQAKSNVGYWSPYEKGPKLHAAVVESQGSDLSGGKWQQYADPTASGGYTRYADAAGARSTLTFGGTAVGLVAPRGPARGEARILINGKEVAVIDLHAATESPRRLVFTRTWRKWAERTIEVVVVGTEGRPRVDVDAYLVLE